MRRFLGKFLLCPTHPQKPPIPATLHATLRINKILYNPRRYEEAEPEVEVFGQALNSRQPVFAGKLDDPLSFGEKARTGGR